MAQINQVAEGIYRISSFSPTVGISFNQFLIDDEHPTLIHTGTYPLYEGVHQAVSEILDPKRLTYIVVSHFEADECGGMGRFLAEAPQAVLVCSLVGARANLNMTSIVLLTFSHDDLLSNSYLFDTYEKSFSGEK